MAPPLDHEIDETIEGFKRFGIEKPFLSVEEAAGVVGLHVNTLRKAIDQGNLKSRKMSANAFRISVIDLAKFALADYEAPKEKVKSKDADAYVFRLPFTIPFRIHHNKSGEIFPEIPTAQDGLSYGVPAQNYQADASGASASVLIRNVQPEHFVLTNAVVNMCPVVSPTPFEAVAEESFHQCLDYLLKSQLTWAPDGGDRPHVWSVPPLMNPFPVEPTLNDGGFTLLPTWEPVLTTPIATFHTWYPDPRASQELWLYSQARAGNQTHSARLGIEGPQCEPGLKGSHYVWRGEISLHWHMGGF